MGLNLWMSYLSSISENSDTKTGENVTCPDAKALNTLLDKIAYSHRWFIRNDLDFALNALTGIAAINDPNFSFSEKANGKTLGFWLRPLSPFDGLDLLLLSLNAGYKCVIRTGETDVMPYKGIIDMLEDHFPYLKGKTEFVDRPVNGVDAWVIAGEAPTAAQLAYFAKKPVFVDTVNQYPTTAVLTGEEISTELDALADDLCMFFGRSKYSISKILVPGGYDFSALLKSLERYKDNGNHARYFNHYEYRKAAYIVSGESVIDNGFLILKKETGSSHFIGVVEYVEYPANDLPENTLKGRQVFKANSELHRGKLIFGSACKRNFSIAAKYLLFLGKIC